MRPIKSYNKVVILGAGGFIGTNLARHLASLNYQVVCFDRNISPAWPSDVLRITGDFSEPPGALLEQLDNAYVFHLISSYRPLPQTTQSIEEVRNDLAGTLQYLEQTKSRDLRWIFLSSGGTVYGRSEKEFLSETEPTRPISSYGLIKLTIESYFGLYRHLAGTDYVTVRLANPYGPWQSPIKGQGIIAALIDKAINEETIEIWGDGGIIRDYIYINDAIKAITACANCGASGEIYNIGSGIGLSINELIETIGRILGKSLNIRYGDSRQSDVKRNVLDTTKFTTNIYSRIAETPLEVGIKETASWIEARAKDFHPALKDR